MSMQLECYIYDNQELHILLAEADAARSVARPDLRLVRRGAIN